VSAQRDPELDELFLGEPELLDLAELMKSAPHPAAHVEPTPQFRVALRRRLMREAWEQASQPEVPWYRRLLAPRPMAGLAAAVGVMLIGLTALSYLETPRGQHSIVTVSSPQNGSETVSRVTPIEVKFNQPMDAKSVQDALSIQPATEVHYAWQENNTRLVITPVHELAPTTRYEVTVAPQAQTKDHQQLPKVATVSFVTASPPPTPPVQPSSSPTSTPSSVLLNPRALGPVGTPAVVSWSPDGSKLFVVDQDGQLQAWAVQGTGTPTATQVAPDGVTAVASAPDGSPAYVRKGGVVYGSVAVPGAQAIALGFRQSSLVFATATDVQTANQQRVAAFKEEATAAVFSQSADRVAYRGTSGLHVVDLATRKDTLVGPASVLGEWSPDGRTFAYATDLGVFTTDGTTPSKLLDDPGVTGLSWSHTNQLLIATGSAVQLASADASQLRTLQVPLLAQPLWAPGGRGTFAYRRAGQEWVAQLPAGMIGPVSSATPGATQDDLVSAFMAARKALQSDQAQAFLDQAGSAAYASRATLLYTDGSQTLNRYYVVLSQPGRVVVRLVLSRAGAQVAVDETLTIQHDATTGQQRIHNVTQTPRPSFGMGPEVLSVGVGGTQVQIAFDSDLAASTVQAGGVSIKGVQTTAAYDTTHKTVTLTIPGGLTPGTAYDLLVSSSLQDVNQRPAVPYTLSITGPGA
jgi:Bacterial Ig-like domain/WD40-like Beta Propeller Repeat